ncbi:AAA domain [Popillia japonica]|uniref:AAA domain n=1 Tax=Popillia japonica TaxID=7064 RepID=A0AAW1MGM8_POPJA
MIASNSFAADMSITVNTVDSFQGLEKDIIILSCVRYTPNSFLSDEQRLNKLSDEQRLNVALTRAKHALYIVGTYSLFKNCALLNRLKMDATRRELYSNVNTISAAALKRIIKRDSD